LTKAAMSAEGTEDMPEAEKLKVAHTEGSLRKTNLTADTRMTRIRQRV
jgi:hypothetical protein